MTHATVTDPVATAEPGLDLADFTLSDRLYDPEQERAVARRLRGIRWRRMLLTGGALALAAAGATGLTLASRDAVEGSTPAATVAAVAPAVPTAPVLQVGPQPAASPDTPVLSSTQSTPVRLPPQSDPNKLQERIITATTPDRPADPAGSASAFAPPAGASPVPEGVRRIPLATGRPITAAANDQPASPAVSPAVTEGSAPTAAPLPPRRPNINR